MAKRHKTKSQTRMELKRLAIEALADKAGRIDPTRVWKAARDPNHPLHDEFEWDVKVAAERYWDETARGLIREVRFPVRYQSHNLLVPTYVADPRSRGEYVSTARIATRADITAAILKRELASIEASINRALSLAVAFDLTDELQRMLHDIVTLKMRMDDDGDDRRGRRRTRRTEAPSVAPA